MPVPGAGEIFGRLTVLGPAPDRLHAGVAARYVLCLCECGNKAQVMASNLRKGATTSCGCLWRERITKHGKVHTRAYAAWEHMHQRCSPSHPEARNYYDRGIRVCAEWTGRGGFIPFHEHMGDPPPRTSVDRIDNSRGYEPGNCRWATQKQQMHNVRTNIWVKLPGGIPAVLAEACRLTGVSRRSVTDKIKREGVSHQDAFDYYLSRLSTAVGKAA